jgi:hypothetical protein
VFGPLSLVYRELRYGQNYVKKGFSDTNANSDSKASNAQKEKLTHSICNWLLISSFHHQFLQSYGLDGHDEIVRSFLRTSNHAETYSMVLVECENIWEQERCSVAVAREPLCKSFARLDSGHLATDVNSGLAPDSLLLFGCGN